MQNAKLTKRRNGVVVIEELKNNQEFIVTDGETKIFLILLIAGGNLSGEVRVKILGQKAKIHILGIILGYKDQKIELNSLQDHIAPGSVSDLLIKSVLFDSAKFYYKGLIKIEKNAQKSNAYQKNQNLLMGKDAWADSRPYLEIAANDVRCTHGVTIGKIDENQLYYLGTRGLDKKEATKLLIKGFFQDVLDRIGNTELRDNLSKKVNSKISQLLNN